MPQYKHPSRDGAFVILHQVRSSECPVTLIEPQVDELYQFMMRAKVAMKFSGGSGFGSNVLEWPQWLMDAAIVMQCAEAMVEQELSKPIAS